MKDLGKMQLNEDLYEQHWTYKNDNYWGSFHTNVQWSLFRNKLTNKNPVLVIINYGQTNFQNNYFVHNQLSGNILLWKICMYIIIRHTIHLFDLANKKSSSWYFCRINYKLTRITSAQKCFIDIFLQAFPGVWQKKHSLPIEHR